MAGSRFKKRSAVDDSTVLTPDLRLISLYELDIRTESMLDYEDASLTARTWKDPSDYCSPTNITEADIGGSHSFCVSCCYSLARCRK